MSRLVTFGCSYTQGEGLSDTQDPNDPSVKSNTGLPSKFAWPQLIANELNIECKNLGVPGGSNKLITSLISNFEFKVGDVCAILWTDYDRWAIFRKDRDHLRIQPSSTMKHSKNYYRYIYDEYDHFLMNTMIFRYTNLHLEKLGIKTYNFAVLYDYCSVEAQEFMLETASIRSLRPLYACADGFHLNEQGQQMLANTMLKYFKQEI